jgi:hypothetical protein
MPSAETATFDAGGNHDQVRHRHWRTWEGATTRLRKLPALAGQKLNRALMPG